MDRRPSEPDAYLRRNSEADPKPTREPYPHWRETKEERRARLAWIRALVFAEANIVTFGQQREINERFLAEKARREAEMPRCVY